MHLSVNLSSETDLKKLQSFLYAKSKQNVTFTGLLEAVASETTIITAIHNIKSNNGSKTAGVDKKRRINIYKFPKTK